MSRLRRGSVVSEQKSVGLPREYQEVEYLESTGVQWIGFGGSIISMDTEFDFSLTYCFTSLKEWSTLFFNWNPDNAFLLRRSGNSNGIMIRYNGEYINNGADLSKHKFEIHKQSNNIFYKLDGVQYSNLVKSCNWSSTLLPYVNFYMAGNNRYNSSAKFYNVYLHMQDIFINAFPAYRISDNKPCMYDLVSQQPFFNQGTGADFIVGPNVY